MCVCSQSIVLIRVWSASAPQASTRSIAWSSNVFPSPISMNCFGVDCVERGQRRVPPPPARMIWYVDIGRIIEKNVTNKKIYAIMCRIIP